MLCKNRLCHSQEKVAYNIQTADAGQQVILIPQGTGAQPGSQQFFLQSAPEQQYNIQPPGGTVVAPPPYVVQQPGTVVQSGGTQQHQPKQQGKYRIRHPPSSDPSNSVMTAGMTGVQERGTQPVQQLSEQQGRFHCLIQLFICYKVSYLQCLAVLFQGGGGPKALDYGKKLTSS